MPIVRVYGLRPTTPPGDLIAWQSRFTDLVRTLPGHLDACVHVAFPSDLLEPLGTELTIIVEGIRCVYGDGFNSAYRDRLALDLASFLFDSVRPQPERVHAVVHLDQMSGIIVVPTPAPVTPANP